MAFGGKGKGVARSYLGEGTVVPQVALVGETVADVAELALLDILLDGVQELLFGDLWHPSRCQFTVLRTLEHVEFGRVAKHMLESGS